MDTSEFTDEQIEALQALADGHNEQSVSRRDVMKLVGAGGVGALLGGGGMAGAVGQASAGTQQVGELGSPGNPIDLDAVEDIYGPGGQGSGDPVNFEAVNTNQLSSKSTVGSYHIYTDGSTVFAIPQDNPFDSNITLDVVTDTDVGLLLEEVIVNQLPPQGSRKEGRGLINLKSGEYPGDLSSPSAGGVVFPMQTWIVGEGQSHAVTNPTKSIPQERMPVRLNFTDRGFIVPNVDGEDIPFGRLKNVSLSGPNDGTGVGLDGQIGSNHWDWTYCENVVIQDCKTAVDTSSGGIQLFKGCHFRNYSGLNHLRSRDYVWQCGISTSKVGGGIVVDRGTIKDSEIEGTGESGTPIVEVQRDTEFTGNAVQKVGGTAGDGVGILATGTGVVDNNTFPSYGTNLAAAIQLDGGTQPKATGNRDFTGSGFSIEVIGTTVEPRIQSNYAPNEIVLRNSPTRPIMEGKVLVSGTPSGSNYDRQHTGLTVYDTSVSPPDEYLIDSAGSLLGPL